MEWYTKLWKLDDTSGVDAEFYSVVLAKAISLHA